MTDFVKSAVFVYDDHGSKHRKALESNRLGVKITPLSLAEMQCDPAALAAAGHVVIAAELPAIKAVIAQAKTYGFSIGFVPLDRQKTLERCYALPKDRGEQIALALKSTASEIDILSCNDQILLFYGVLGRLPLFEGSEKPGTFSVLRRDLSKLWSLGLEPMTISTTGINSSMTATAAAGCIILESPQKNMLSNMVGNDCTFNDGMISLVIISPFSILDYLHLMWIRIVRYRNTRGKPDSIGFIKSSGVSIETDSPMDVIIDGDVATTTPVKLQVEPKAIRINHGFAETASVDERITLKEKNLTASLPSGKEVHKARSQRIPFFRYASEQRFKDLFVALRADAKLETTYIVLMVLSTIIATVGLYLDSASVIIGAMLLAPLMAPIISLAMGLLRYDRVMFRQSLIKIGVGIGLALSTSALITLISPYQPLTSEMQGRLNPTVLDLAVAVVAGIAGAYTKSFKEILQSLAGVAIAVALVPPLAVAGTGLGRLDPGFFSQAFLLFLTNLIGIVLAATFTFRVLGFSPVVHDKRSISIVCMFLFAIFIPLYLAFNGIVERQEIEKGWRLERFFVNGKYLIVDEAKLIRFKGNKVLTVQILAREQLSRHDLSEFKRKVKRNLSDDLVIRADITYIP